MPRFAMLSQKVSRWMPGPSRNTRLAFLWKSIKLNPNSKNQNPKVEFEFLIVDFVHGLDFDYSCHRSDLNYDLTLVAGCSTWCYFWREDL